MWIFYRIKDFIRDIPKNIKWFFQRGRKGYSDCDIWSMDDWFTETVIPMLKQLKETKHEYPMGLTEEQWDKIISEMIYYFTEMTEDGCSMKNEYEEQFHTWIWGNPTNCNDIKEKWLNKEEQISKYRNDMKDKAFFLFSKYFWNLWD